MLSSTRISYAIAQEVRQKFSRVETSTGASIADLSPHIEHVGRSPQTPQIRPSDVRRHVESCAVRLSALENDIREFRNFINRTDGEFRKWKGGCGSGNSGCNNGWV